MIRGIEGRIGAWGLGLGDLCDGDDGDDDGDD